MAKAVELQNGVDGSHGRCGQTDRNGTALQELIGAASPLVQHELASTRLPYLDTLDHSVVSQNRGDTTNPDTLKLVSLDDLSTSKNKKADIQPLAALQKYAVFVLNLTGDKSCYIACRIAASPGSIWRGCIQATRPDAETQRSHDVPVCLRAFRADRLQDCTLDFAFEYGDDLKGDATFMGTTVPFAFRANFLNDTPEFSVLYNTLSISHHAIAHLLRALRSSLISGSSSSLSDTELSVLNYPPRRVSRNQDETFLHSGFLTRVQANPEREALSFLRDGGLQSFTYRELFNESQRLATRIQLTISKLQDTPQIQQHIIPVYLSSSVELYVSYLAVLLAGHAFCPLPVDAPVERQHAILQDINAPLILGSKKPSQKSISDIPEMQNVPWLAVDGGSVDVNVVSFRPLSCGDLAYVMYTSGTTGKPKGVQITHEAAWSSIDAHIEANPLQMDGKQIPRWFQFAAPTFDPSIMEIFVTLTSGATLCSAPRESTLGDVEEVVSKLKATVMMTTPSVASLIRPERVPSLKNLWTMGEALNRKVVERFSSLDGEIVTNGNGVNHLERKLTNAYGPTEAAINCTMVADVPRSQRGSVIGRPLSSCAMYVLDMNSASLEPTPIGMAGELAISGPQLSIGYLNRPEANKLAFVTHPRYGRLYRTGDKARVVWSPDGQATLDYLGRINDEQVKINGQRVELAEIDLVLSSVAEVSEAATVMYNPDHSSTGSEMLIACVVPVAKHAASDKLEDVCRTALGERLPTYMHPHKYFITSSLPRSSSDKLDRRALASRAVEHIHASNGYAQTNGHHDSTSKNPIQETIKETLNSISGSIDGSVSSRLTLDSLTSMRLLQRLRDRGIEELSLKDLLHARSISEIAQVIKKRRDSLTQRQLSDLASLRRPSRVEVNEDVSRFGSKWAEYCRNELDLSKQEEVTVLPTTATQSRLLLSVVAGNASNSSGRYVNQTVFRLHKSVDCKKLREAWKTVLERHDAFRVQFVAVDDDLAPFAQCIRKSMPPNYWSDVDRKKGLDIESAEDKASSTAKELIDLRNPYNVTLIEATESNSIVLTLLHAIFDYGSLKLLVEEVESEYFHRKPVPKTSISDVVRNHFNETSDTVDNYWSDYLDESPSTSFPQLTGLRPELATRACRSSTTSSQVTIYDLTETSRVLGCSPLAIVQATWSAVLFAYTGAQTQEVVFDSLFANRSDPETESCMGPAFSVVPTRVRSTHATGSVPTIAEVLHQLTEDNAKARDYLHPRIKARHRRKATYDTILALQVFNAKDDDSKVFAGETALPMAQDHAVMIEVWPGRSGHLSFKATYTDTHLDEQSAKLMNEQLASLLQWILQNPERRFSSILGAVGTEQLSISNPNPVLDSEHNAKYPFIQSQFEEFALKQPDSPALVFVQDVEDDSKNVEWSYSELNAKANSFAKLLLDRLGPLNGSIIPLTMEKRPELYTAVLGIVKAGGAWCPVDTSSPPARRRELISRTDSPILIVAQEEPVDADGYPEGTEILNLASIELQIGDKMPRPHQLTQPSNPAYLIWTSGTTGLPKGVPVSHSAAVTSMKALQDDIPGKSTKHDAPRCTQFSQHTFDVFVQDLFYTWGLGGTVLSATKEILVGSFPEFVKMTDASHAHLTPAFGTGVERRSCPSLEVITMIGEKLPQHVADNWGENMEAYNTYGPAEATVVSTWSKFKGSEERVKSTNIGKPLKSVSCYVVRDGSLIMAQGVGELALGGHQLASGYYKNPEKTSEKFIWNEQVGEVIYLTGDIVRVLANGTIEFVGREDDLVKLGGIRVELSEISFALRDCHPEALQIETFHMQRPDRASKLVVSFVAVRSDDNDGSSLLSTGTLADEVMASVLKQGRKSLPDFMLPSVIIAMKKIPKTPSAKVDRKILQSVFEGYDINSQDPGSDSVMDGELSGQDREIIDIVSGLGGVPIDQIKLSSYLPLLGIDSLNAGRLASRLRATGVPVQIKDILKSRTIADLLANTAREVEVDNHAGFDISKFDNTWHHPVAVAGGLSQGFVVLPASPLQDGLIGESISTRGSYWSNHLFKLDPALDLQKLRVAWQEVADGTEGLRTCFMPVSSIPSEDRPEQLGSAFLQIIHQQHEIDWVDGWTCTGENVHEAAQKRFTAITQACEDASFSKPPWSVTTIDSGETRYMMLTIHHSLHDAKSLEYITKDVASAYKGKLPVKYRHQLSQCMEIILDVEEESNIKFWEETLNEFAHGEELAWPDLTGKPEHQIDKDNPQLLTLERTMNVSLDELQGFARELGVSPASVIRAALGVILTDYLESPKVVFGEINSQRMLHPELEDAIAPLVTTVPIPFKVDQTVRELLTQQEHLVRSLREHQTPSGATIRRLLDRPMSQPLFPAVFVFHPSEDSSNEIEEWQSVPDSIGLTVEHPFALNVTQRDGWQLELSAQDTFITTDHLEIIAKQIEALVQCMITNPDAPIVGILDFSSPQVISIAESQLPCSESHPSASYPTWWLDHHAEEHPSWPAVEVASQIVEGSTVTEAWTYETLSKESNRVARMICDFGYSDKVIALCAGRTLQSYAAIVGILKSGNTYLPVDDRLPQDRKQLLLEDSGCVVLFTDDQCLELIPDSLIDCRVVNLDGSDTRKQLASLPSTKLPLVDPSTSSYLLYTSGSTGKPKGVLVSHRSLCGFVEGLSSRMYESSEDVYSKTGVGKWLGLASRAFDVHLGEMFLAWKLGLTAVTAPRETLLDDLRLALTELKVTHTIIVPSLLEQAGIERSQIPNVIFMAIGGEKLTRHIIDKWGDQPGLTTVNAYGPTELAIGCTASHIVPTSTVRDIGRPYSNSQAHVLLPGSFNYAKRGQSGELCFTGCLVGNGYLNRPDAKGFVESFRGQRMYRTGDMVRMMANDHLDYLGRSDDQTKIRGQRIELAEVSETIRAASEDPIDVATLVLTHPSISASQLVSFVADQAERSERYGAKPEMLDQKTRSADLQARCRERLPKYMVPDHVVPVSIIPLAQISGKVDAKVVKAFFSSLEFSRLLGSGAKVESGPTRDLTEEEEIVKDAILNVLKIDDSSLVHNANLLVLGFDSLSIVGLVLRLRKAGFSLTVASVLANPTIEEIAARKDGVPVQKLEPVQLVEERLKSSVEQESEASDVEQVLPCLPLQESLVATTLNSSETFSYVNHTIFQFRQAIEQPRLKKAWETLVASSPIMRTTFRICEDEILQVVHKNQKESQWSTAAYPNVEEAKRELQRSYDSISKDIVSTIGTISPWRCQLVELEEGNAVFLLSIHHALYDGNSLDMMLDDLRRLYQNEEVVERTNVEALLREEATHSQDERKKFWTDYLSGLTPSPVAKSNSSESESSKSVSMSSTFSDLQAAAKSLKVTPASLLQSIFGAIIAKASNSADISFGTILSGRSVPVDGADTILAPCLTTIPQRISFNSGVSNLGEVAQNVQAQYASCLEHQHTPLRLINKWAGAERPLFDCLYSFNQTSAAPYHDPFIASCGTSMALDYPLAIEFLAKESEDSITANCSFTSAFGSEQEVESLIEEMNILIGAFCRGESIKLSDLDITDVQVQEQEKQEWSETDWTSEEKLVRETVANVAKTDQSAVTKNGSFFRLGIDSISAIRLANELRGRGFKVSSSDVMKYTCIGALCAHFNHDADVPSKKSSSDGSQISKDQLPTLGDEDEIETTYTCTPLQTGMITGTLVSKGSLYVHHHAMLLNENIDKEALKSAWIGVVEQLDILRTSFHYYAGVKYPWVAAVHSAPPLDWFVESSSELRDAKEELILSNEEDFTRPPVRAGIKTVSQGRLFVLTMHHALYDGNSIPMLFDMIAKTYSDKAVSLERTPFSEAAQVISQQESQSVKFWLEQLSDYKAPGFQHQEDQDTSSTFIERKIELDPEYIEATCKSLGVTMQTIVLVAFGKSLGCALGQRDVVFGHVIAGRTLPIDGIDDIVGPLFNTIPFRLRLENTLQQNQKTLSIVQEHTAKAQSHQHAPLQRIQNSWRRQQKDPSSKLFDALFLFQVNRNQSADSQKLWKPYQWDSGITGSDYRINFEVEQNDSGLVLSVSGLEDSTTDAELNQLLDNFGDVVKDLLANPSRSVLAYPKSLSNLPLFTTYDTSATDTESIDEHDPNVVTVRNVLAETSGVPEDNIGPDTNIFALGLDSISAINVAGQCRDNGVPISVAQVLQGATLGGIVRLASAAQSVKTSNASTPLDYENLVSKPVPAEKIESLLPCLAGQTYHLAGWLQSGRTLLAPTWAFKCPKLDSQKFEQAWAQLRSRHSILRTTFALKNEVEVVQIVLKAEADKQSFYSLDSSTDIDSVKKLVHEEQGKGFDLSRPPLRLCHVRGDEEDVVLLTLNHALYDAWSLPILLSDLSKIYKSAKLDPQPQFADCVSHILSSVQPGDEVSYWKEALRDHSRTIIGSHESSEGLPVQNFIHIPSVVTNVSQLQSTVRKYNLTLTNIILLAISRILAKETSTTNPTFGVYQAGRSISFTDVSKVSGPLLNITPLRVRDPLRKRCFEAAKELQSDLQARVPFEQSDLPSILEWAGVKDTVIFNTFVNLLWHNDQMSFEESLLERLDVGLPTDFARTHAFEGTTSLDGLCWPVAKEGVFIDVSLRDEEVHLGVRVEGGNVDLEQLKGMLSSLGSEVTAIVEGLDG